jgi:hypothetical protein
MVGLDPLRAAKLQPGLFAHQAGLIGELVRPDTVILSQGAAERLRLGTGGRLRLLAGLDPVSLEVIGTLPASSAPGVVAITDIATAQWRLHRLGELNRIGLRLAPGADREALRARIAALLPAGAHVSGVETAEESGAALSRAYRVNLNVLALVALFTGGFLVFSTQALEVARRRGEHALLRVLGLARGALARLVLAEAGLVGAAGAALGLRWATPSPPPLCALPAATWAPGCSAASRPRCASRRSRRSLTSARGSWWRSPARCCPRSMRRARRPRRRSRRATSSACFRARLPGAPRPRCSPRGRCSRWRRRWAACRSRATRRSPACWSGASCSCRLSRSSCGARCRSRGARRSRSPARSCAARRGRRW